MESSRAYRVLCGALGVAFGMVGLLLFFGFFAYHAPNSDPPIPTGPTGFYFVAFAGCAMVGWGGCLLASLRDARVGRSAGSVTAFALVLSALYRMVAWVAGDYAAWAGDATRFEAIAFLALALALVWLRPRPLAESAS